MFIDKATRNLFDKKIERVIKIHYVITLFIRITLLLAFIGALCNQRWAILFAISLTFILTFLPNLFEQKYKIYLPVEFEIVIILFIYASLFLGEMQGYYSKFWWWDIFLHTGSAIAFGFIGFTILYILNKGNRLNTKPIWIAIFSFCFAMAIGGVWEIFEFVMDQIFSLNMQKSGLVDTMWDLIVDCIGAIIASIIGFFYLKKRDVFLFGKTFKRFELENQDFFK
ncbi:hypothetical protein K9L16_00140 [Candidatus Pacearchaeota archaeon]|nr:hypothetical protein [Candidatus Pacearchaeota archaeon]